MGKARGGGEECEGDLLPRSNIHKLITKTILQIDTIKEISCKTVNV